MDGELAGTTFRPLRLHRIYRLRVERDGDRVRLITRGGYNWTKRYPWIVEAALRNRYKLFVIDGEAVVLGVDGISDFNALHSGKHNDEVQFYAFDIPALDGDDLRHLPLIHAQGPSFATVSATAGWDLHQPIRRRARSAPIYFAPPATWVWKVWSRSVGTALSRRPIEGLGEGQEPQAPSN
jgi:hypothetical protein